MSSTEAPWRDAVALDGAHRRADLHRGLGEHDLDRFGAAARGLGLGARHAEAGDDLLDGRQLLLRGAGRLAGAAGDLLHRPAQFFRRGRGLGEAAGQLLGGRGEALGDLVLRAGGHAPGRAVLLAVARRRPSRRAGRCADRATLGGGVPAVQLGLLDEGHWVPWDNADCSRWDAVARISAAGCRDPSAIRCPLQGRRPA